MRLLAGLLILSFLVTSCSTVKEARRVQREPSAQLPGEYTVKVVDSGLVPGSTVALAELEAIALRCNPSVLQADLNVESAVLSLANAKAGYMPTLNLSAGHNRSTANTNTHRQTTRNSGNYSGGLNFSLLLYDFGKTSAAVAQAQQELLAAEEERRGTRNLVVYNTRKAFFQLRRAMGLHQVAVDAVAQYQEHLEQVKVKLEVGSSLRYDVTKAEVDYNNALLNEITTSNNIAVGWAQLNYCLGLAEDPKYSVQDSPIKEYAGDVDTLMALARKQDPDLLALELQVAAASAALDGAIAELYPTFAIGFSGNVGGRDPGLPWLWNLALSLTGTQNLFNAGRTMNAIKAATLNLRRARSQYAAKEQTVYRNLREAVLVSNKARRSYQVAQLAEKSARENLEIVNEKYKHGKASSVDRTDAQVSHSSAKAAVVTAHFDYAEAQAALAYMIGE